MANINTKRISLAVCVAVVLTLLAAAILFMPRLHAEGDAVVLRIKDDYEHASVVSFLIKGDVNGDYAVGPADLAELQNIVDNNITTLSTLKFQACDINSDNSVNAQDVTLLSQLLNGQISFPNSNFTYSLSVRPDPGYMVSALRAPGYSYGLTPWFDEVVGNKLSVDEDGVATITGMIPSTSDGKSKLSEIKIDPISPAITLKYGTDSHGTIDDETGWFLGGDIDRTGSVYPYAETEYLYAYLAGALIPPDGKPLKLTESQMLAGDTNDDHIVNVQDLNRLLWLGTSEATLPAVTLSYNVTDTPDEGYEVAYVRIISTDGTVILTQANPTSGDFSLDIDENGVASVSGLSRSSNDVYFAHVNPLSIPVFKTITGGVPATNATFSFSIAANTTVSGDSVLPAVLPDTTTCTISGSGETGFDPIIYDKAGKYYYNVTETNGGVVDYEYDSTNYIVCVQVKNDDGGLKAEIAAVWKEQMTEAAKQPFVTFSNRYTLVPSSLTLSKTVTGELADKRLGFTFTVTFTGTGASTYNFDAGVRGKIQNGTGTITLMDAEHVTFTDLPQNVNYSITETGATTYKTSIDNNGSPLTNNKVATGTVPKNGSVSVAYTNNLPYTPVVGLSMDTLPFVLLGVLSIGCIVFVVVRKHKCKQ